jgi:hypothetical protein
VRPTLLNYQEWLRFWVEEHLVLPNIAAGSKAQGRARLTASFNSHDGHGSTQAAAAAAEGAGQAGGLPVAGASSASSLSLVRAIR